MEFSRPVPLARIGFERFRQEIAATEAECAALAKRFDLVVLDRLTAIVELEREPEDTILLRARFAATFSQSCVVTLDPVAGEVAEEFTLRYGMIEAEPDAVEDDSGEGPAFEPLTGDAIDVGEAVAQEFSLALPPFPRCEGAIIEAEAEPAADGPFAALARLNPPPGS